MRRPFTWRDFVEGPLVGLAIAALSILAFAMMGTEALR